MKCRFHNEKNLCGLVKPLGVDLALMDGAVCKESCSPIDDRKKWMMINMLGFYFSEPASLDIPIEIELNRLMDYKRLMTNTERVAIKENKKAGKDCGDCLAIKPLNIVASFTLKHVRRILGLNTKSFIEDRITKCLHCHYHTWIPTGAWLVKLVQRNKQLPLNHAPNEGDRLCCAVCKCDIEAKIQLKKSTCPKLKW
jgi:hypothetical protein